MIGTRRPAAFARSRTAARRRRTVGALGALAMVATTLALAVATSEPADAAPGSVSGTVFRDFNADGFLNTTSSATLPAVDVGVGGVTVRAYDTTGAVVGTATTATDGTYTLAYTAAGAGTDVRVEFDTPVGYRSGPRGTGAGIRSGTSVQFRSSGQAAHYGIAQEGDHAQPNPTLVLPVHRGWGNSSTNPPTTADRTRGVLYAAEYNATGNIGITSSPTPRRIQARQDQIGTTFGLAPYRTTHVFTGAYLRRHAPLGPGGTGAVYLTAIDSGTPNGSVFVTIPNAGANPRGANDTNLSYDWFHDVAAAPAVSKVALGDIDISADGRTLYAVNLNDRQVYAVPVVAPTTPGGAPTAGTPVAIALPLALPGAATGCADADVRPFGLEPTSTALYATLTCTGPAAADLRGYLYRYDLAAGTWSLAFEMGPMSGYSRGSAVDFGGTINHPATWTAWTDTVEIHTTSWGALSHPEPLLSDVEFDSNGDVSLAVMDRFGAKGGADAGGLDPASPAVYYTYPAGDILRACRNVADTAFVLENDGSCGTRTGFSSTNNEGPGGGEFYSDSYGGSTHEQTALGSSEQVPGFPQVVTTVYDPLTTVNTAGWKKLNNSNGGVANGTQVQSAPSLDTGTFAKVGGLGDIEALLEPAPIEIGNRVWLDVDRDGVQDPGEAPIAGVTVRLYQGATLVGTAVTDANGEYYFNAANVVGGVLPETAYRIAVDLPADYAAGGPLVDRSLTVADADAPAGIDDAIDSDGTSPPGGFPEVTLTTGTAGANDHTFDFGFNPTFDLALRKTTTATTVAVGDVVPFELEIFNQGQAAATNIEVTDHLPPQTELAATGNAGWTDNGDGTASYVIAGPLAVGASTTITINLEVTAYAPQIDNLAEISNAFDGAGNPGNDLDSTPDTDDGNDVLGDDVIDNAGGDEDDHDIASVTVVPSVSVGDFVWLDSDADGVQDPGEPGIEDVTLTITGPGGVPVVDVFGDPVGPTQTDADGAYSFDGLPALAAGESYTVTIDAASPALDGYAPTVTGAGTPATDSSTGSASSGDLTDDGDRDPTLDFGFVDPPEPVVSVGDFVWVDTDRDGVQDAGEPGIEDVTLTLTGPGGTPVTDVNGDPVGPTTTDANGAYTFVNLPVLAAGESYTVTIDAASPALDGYVPTITGSGTTATDSSTGSVASGDLTDDGDRDDTLDFGFVTPSVSVGDFVWVDTDRDGVQDAGEPGIEDVTLTITGPGGVPVVDVFGDPVGPVQTDADGAYSFDGLPALVAGESYTVTIDVTSPALDPYLPTIAGAGADESVDSSTGSEVTGDLTDDGDRDPTLDFGFVLPSVSVGDFVWVDTDRDGVQDPGEPGIEDVTLTITGPGGLPVVDVFGDPVAPITTDADGAYSFDDLPALAAGLSYTVTVDGTSPALDPYVPTITGAGTPATDSSTGSATSGDLTDDGDRDPTLDFGFVLPSVSVGDFVWVDTDRDGVQDPGEPGIEGVSLTITGPGGLPVADVFGDPVGQVTTDVDGAYSFDDLPALPAGQSYTVTIDGTSPALAGYIPTITGAGTTATDSSTGSATSGDLTDDGDRDDTLDFGFVVATFDLALRKTTPSDIVAPGDEVTYTITVFNQGEATATDIVVTDTLPAGLEFDPADNAGWTLADGDPTTTIPGPLAPGEDTEVSITLTVAASADASTDLVNTAEISEASDEDGDQTTDVDSTPDRDPTNDELTDDEIDSTPTGDPADEDDHDVAAVRLFDLALRKTTTATVVQVGDVVPFTLTVFNQGRVAASQYTVTDHLPAELAFDPADNPGWVDNGDGTVSITIDDTLLAGASAEVTLNLEVTAAALEIDNLAEISEVEGPNGTPVTDADSTPDDDPTNDELTDDEIDSTPTGTPPDEDDHDIATITAPVFDLALRKTTTATEVSPGDTVPFTITVFNQGEVIATDIVVTDTVPTGLLFDPADNPGWTLVDGAPTTTIAGPLAPGASTEVVIELTVAAGTLPPTLVNTAEISEASDEDGDPTTDVDSTPDTDPGDDELTDDEIDSTPTGTPPDEDDHDIAEVTTTDTAQVTTTTSTPVDPTTTTSTPGGSSTTSTSTTPGDPPTTPDADPPASPRSPRYPYLPRTGTDALRLALVGLALVGSGFGLLRLRRRSEAGG